MEKELKISLSEYERLRSELQKYREEKQSIAVRYIVEKPNVRGIYSESRIQIGTYKITESLKNDLDNWAKEINSKMISLETLIEEKHNASIAAEKETAEVKEQLGKIPKWIVNFFNRPKNKIKV